MKITDEQLQDMLQKSQYGKPEIEPEFWFSFNNQKRLAYDLAVQLVIQGEDITVAIDLAKEFVDAFYKKAIKNGSWER